MRVFHCTKQKLVSEIETQIPVEARNNDLIAKNFIQKENEPFQRQHGSTKFSLSAGRKFLLLHSYLYPVFPQTFIIFLIFHSAPKCSVIVVVVAGDAKRVHT